MLKRNMEVSGSVVVNAIKEFAERFWIIAFTIQVVDVEGLI